MNIYTCQNIFPQTFYCRAWIVCLIFLYCWFISFYPRESCDSRKLIDIYRTKHNISALTSLSDPTVAIWIFDLIYESTKPALAEPGALDDDLVNVWAANLGDDGLLGNNEPIMSKVKFDLSTNEVQIVLFYV